MSGCHFQCSLGELRALTLPLGDVTLQEDLFFFNKLNIQHNKFEDITIAMKKYLNNYEYVVCIFTLLSFIIRKKLSILCSNTNS